MKVVTMKEEERSRHLLHMLPCLLWLGVGIYAAGGMKIVGVDRKMMMRMMMMKNKKKRKGKKRRKKRRMMMMIKK